MNNDGVDISELLNSNVNWDKLRNDTKALHEFLNMNQNPSLYGIVYDRNSDLYPMFDSNMITTENLDVVWPWIRLEFYSFAFSPDKQTQQFSFTDKFQSEWSQFDAESKTLDSEFDEDQVEEARMEIGARMIGRMFFARATYLPNYFMGIFRGDINNYWSTYFKGYEYKLNVKEGFDNLCIRRQLPYRAENTISLVTAEDKGVLLASLQNFFLEEYLKQIKFEGDPKEFADHLYKLVENKELTHEEFETKIDKLASIVESMFIEYFNKINNTSLTTEEFSKLYNEAYDRFYFTTVKESVELAFRLGYNFIMKISTEDRQKLEDLFEGYHIDEVSDQEGDKDKILIGIRNPNII